MARSQNLAILYWDTNLAYLTITRIASKGAHSLDET
jgi:hypothetical protein